MKEYKGTISLAKMRELWDSIDIRPEIPTHIYLDGIKFKIGSKKFRDYFNKHYAKPSHQTKHE